MFPCGAVPRGFNEMTLLMENCKICNKINKIQDHSQSVGVNETLNFVMRKILDLGQSSLPEHQFRAFRKMVMDFFAEGKRNFGKGWCGKD